MSTALAKKSVPPFPKERHWLFGSAYLIRNSTHLEVEKLIHQYGDIFSLSFPLVRLVVVATPEYAKYVLLDNNKNYRKSLAYDMIRELLGNGLLTSEGDFWKKQRRLVQPAFHKQKLADLTAMMVNRTAQEVEKLKTKTESGEHFDVLTQMTALTLDIISEAIFSNGINDEKADLISRQITLLNEGAKKRLDKPVRFPNWVPTPSNLRNQKAIETLDNVIYEIIDERRKSGESKSDLLSMLLDARDEETGEAMDNRQLRDEIMTIFVAGNETTANAMAWTLYLLSQNPEAEENMIREIDEKLDAGIALDFENVMKFQYVRQVIEESMRLFPPAWTVGRRANEDDEIGGYRIIKDTNVLIPIWYFHHSEKYWDEPMKFKPERFAPEKRNSIDRFVYFPFGGGPRLCIGNNFALLEMQIILIQLYRNFQFHLKENFVVNPRALITLRPENGMMMRVEKRL